MLYKPYFENRYFGTPDDGFYLLVLQDLIAQLKAGIFPQYIPQSAYLADGNGFAAGPLYGFMGQLIYLSGLGKTPLLIQHYTVLLSAFLSTLFLYLILCKLIPKSPWISALLTLLYLSCPGVMTLIYGCSMYASFMALPFIPLVIFSLNQIYKSGDYRWSFLGGSSLALVWFAHPPIGLFLVFCAIIISFAIINPWEKNKKILLFWAIFMAAYLWQFLVIFSLNLLGGPPTEVKLGLSELAWSLLTPNPSWAHGVLRDMHGLMPQILFPIQYGDHNYRGFQLGYSLWFLAGVVFIYAMKIKTDKWLKALLILIAFFILLANPIKDVTDWLWSFLPGAVSLLNPIWPNMRLFPILAILIIFSIASMLKDLNIKKQSLMIAFKIFIFVLCLWSATQAYYLVNQSNAITTQFKEQFPLLENKTYFHTDAGMFYDTLVSFGHYDPYLRFRVLDKNFKPISELNNYEYITNKCINGPKAQQENLKFLAEEIKKVDLSKYTPIAQISVPGLQFSLICFEILDMSANEFFIDAWNVDNGVNSKYFPERIDINIANEPYAKERKIAIFPIYIPRDGDHKINFSAWSTQKMQVGFGRINLISYSHDELPIKVKSFTPLTAQFEWNKEANLYFQPFKIYSKSFVATVNGEAEIIKPYVGNSMVLPINTMEGNNIIKISFSPPILLKITFYVSLMMLIFSFGYFIIKSLSDYINIRKL